MIKVTLLGDSIRQSYSFGVSQMLGDEFDVYAPADNSRFAKYTLRQIFEERENMRGTRIVHFNNGMWDICNLFGDGTFTSEQEYIDNVLRIADILLSKYEKVIFATTTPVRKNNCYNNINDIIRFNEVIVPKLQEKGVIINDLFTPVAEDIDGNVSDDTLHLSEKGVAICEKLVVEAIKKAAAELK